MKLRVLLFVALSFVAGQALAGLFSDEEAHLRIQKLEERFAKLEEKLQEAHKQQSESDKQKTQSMLDLQTQIENTNAEMRMLRGQNEELLHNQQDAEKRQKDFYVDLDSRIRHFESMEARSVAAPPPAPPAAAPEKAPEAVPTEGPAVENRAYEGAYSLARSGNHLKAISAYLDFLKKFPESVYVPVAYYEIGSSYIALKEYANARDIYQELLDKHPYSSKAPDALLGIADCQQRLKDKAAARKTLKQVIAKYPGSAAADQARSRLKSTK